MMGHTEWLERRVKELKQEIETLKAGREEAVKLVLDAGLSTGHADTCGDLMLEVMGEIESLRGQLADCQRKHIDAMELVKKDAMELIKDKWERGDEWKRLAGARQARIDALMFEFCPDDMTADQIAEYEKQQREEE